jgi:hypothetical protein
MQIDHTSNRSYNQVHTTAKTTNVSRIAETHATG